HQSLALPVTDRVSHKQAYVGPYVRSSVSWDNARHVVVLIHHDEITRTLDDLIRVPVVGFERTGQHTACRLFDVGQRSRRYHLWDKFGGGWMRVRPPRQHPIRRIDHTSRPSLNGGTILGRGYAGVEDCWIGLARAPKVA